LSKKERHVERKDFKDWQVTVVYMFQEGVCHCGNSLANGFHRHHIDGNAENVSLDNLELRCAECHRATYRGRKRKQLMAHREHEKKIFADLNNLITQTLEGKLSGATSERLLEALSMSLKVSRRINRIDEDLEYPPPTITIFKRLVEQDILKDTYLEGFKDALSSIRTEAGDSGLERAIKELDLTLQGINKALWTGGKRSE